MNNIYERFEQSHFAVCRLERFGETVEILPEPRRSISEQRQKFAEASRLIDRGWGIYLDNHGPPGSVDYYIDLPD